MLFSALTILVAVAVGTQGLAINEAARDTCSYECPATDAVGDTLQVPMYGIGGGIFGCLYDPLGGNSYGVSCTYEISTGVLLDTQFPKCPTMATPTGPPFQCPATDAVGDTLQVPMYGIGGGIFGCLYDPLGGNSYGVSCTYSTTSGALLDTQFPKCRTIASC